MTIYNGISGTKTIPVELAEARTKRSEAWAEYMQVIEREHTPAEFHAALTKAGRADIECNLLYDRWQRLGGTSNIQSIVETETFLNELSASVAEMKQAAVEIEPWNEIPDGTEPSPYISGGEIIYPVVYKSGISDNDMPF